MESKLGGISRRVNHDIPIWDWYVKKRQKSVDRFGFAGVVVILPAVSRYSY